VAAVGRLAIPLCSLDAIHGDPLFFGEDYPEIKLSVAIAQIWKLPT